MNPHKITLVKVGLGAPKGSYNFTRSPLLIEYLSSPFPSSSLEVALLVPSFAPTTDLERRDVPWFLAEPGCDERSPAPAPQLSLVTPVVWPACHRRSGFISRAHPLLRLRSRRRRRPSPAPRGRGPGGPSPRRPPRLRRRGPSVVLRPDEERPFLSGLSARVSTAGGPSPVRRGLKPRSSRPASGGRAVGGGRGARRSVGGYRGARPRQWGSPRRRGPCFRARTGAAAERGRGGTVFFQ